MSKNNIKTKTVLTLDSKAEKRKYVSDVLKANGYTTSDRPNVSLVDV